MAEGMLPDQRDRLVRLESEMAQIKADFTRVVRDIEAVREIVSRLDRQSQWVRGGIILIVAIGGILTFALDAIKKIFP